MIPSRKLQDYGRSYFANRFWKTSEKELLKQAFSGRQRYYNAVIRVLLVNKHRPVWPNINQEYKMSTTHQIKVQSNDPNIYIYINPKGPNTSLEGALGWFLG